MTGGDENGAYQHSVISQRTIADFDESLITQPQMVCIYVLHRVKYQHD